MIGRRRGLGSLPPPPDDPDAERKAKLLADAHHCLAWWSFEAVKYGSGPDGLKTLGPTLLWERIWDKREAAFTKEFGPPSGWCAGWASSREEYDSLMLGIKKYDTHSRQAYHWAEVEQNLLPEVPAFDFQAWLAAH
jgi:hypothetical protein